MSDLDTLFPDRELTVGGETLSIRPLTFGQLPAAVKLLNPVIKAVGASGLLGGEKKELGQIITSGLDLFAVGGEDLLAFLAFAVRKPREWFDTMEADDGIRVLNAVFEANMDFFNRRVLPQLGLQAAASDGDSSSASSSQPVTDAPTSTDTP